MRSMNSSTQTLQRPAVAHEPGMPALPSLAVHATLPERRRLSSQALLGNEREVEIEHGGQLYRLRLTSLGKLILTK